MRKVTPWAKVKAKKPPKVRVPVKKRNAKRKGKRFPNRRDLPYLAWLHTQPCAITRTLTGEWLVIPTGTLHRAHVVAAHNPSRGSGGWDKDALPLDSVLHEEQHRIGIKSFCEKYNLNWAAEVVRHRARYIDQTE